MRLETLRNSPITRTELFYQQRAQTSPKHSLTPLSYAMMTMLALFSIVVGIFSLSGAYVEQGSTRILLTVFYLLLTVLHFKWMLRTLTLASASVTREKRDNERWEALLLTGVSGREIVLGKWWATLKTMWRSYAFLAFLRAAAAITFIQFGQNIIPFYANYYRYPAPSSFPMLIFGVVFIVLFTLANLPYTAACGVMSAMETKHGSGVGRALAARTAFTVLGAIIPMLLWTFFGFPLMRNVFGWDYIQTSEISNFLSSFMGIMLENGMGLSSNIVVSTTWVHDHPFSVVILFLSSLATYAGLTWALLWFAQWRAERLGALKSVETEGK